MKKASVALWLAALMLTTGCAERLTPEQARQSDLDARASHSAEAAAAIPGSVIATVKAACEADLRSRADGSNGKYVHTLESVEFVGNVSEYNLRNRPHAYGIETRYGVRMADTGQRLTNTKTCCVRDDGQVEWLPS